VRERRIARWKKPRRHWQFVFSSVLRGAYSFTLSTQDKFREGVEASQSGRAWRLPSMPSVVCDTEQTHPTSATNLRSACDHRRKGRCSRFATGSWMLRNGIEGIRAEFAQIASNSGSGVHLEGMNMRSIYKACLPAVAAAFAFAAVAAFAQPSPAVKEDKAQMKSDKSELQRDKKQLKADKRKLKSDKASGRMAAESKDSQKVNRDRQTIKGEKKDIAADKPGSLQMKSDKAALQREKKQLKADKAKRKSDKAAGKMAAESKDSAKVNKDRQNIKGDKKDIAADKAKLKADEKK
jgi:hypothetical protein